MTSLEINASLKLRRKMVERIIKQHFARWLNDYSVYSYDPDTFCDALRLDLESSGLLIYSSQINPNFSPQIEDGGEE